MSSTLVIVTGASRGLGKAIALSFVKKQTLEKCSLLRISLLARSEEGLTDTKSLIRQKADELLGKDSTDVVVITNHAIDLSDLGNLENNFNGILDCTTPPRDSVPQFDKAILINNAGSLGHLGPSTSMTSLKQLQKTIDFNITSAIWISTRFVQTFSTDQTKTTIVNISSLCAIEPFKTMGVYCAGKAARDMFHAVLARETQNIKEANAVKILNYAPGALETDMTNELIDCDVLDKDLHDFYVKSKKEKTAIMPEDTADRLWNLLLADEFESGKHIDYWDLKQDDNKT